MLIQFVCVKGKKKLNLGAVTETCMIHFGNFLRLSPHPNEFLNLYFSDGVKEAFEACDLGHLSTTTHSRRGSGLQEAEKMNVANPI